MRIADFGTDLATDPWARVTEFGWVGVTGRLRGAQAKRRAESAHYTRLVKFQPAVLRLDVWL